MSSNLKISIKELDAILKTANHEDFLIVKAEHAEDSRKNIQDLFKKYERKFEKLEKLNAEYDSRLKYERALWKSGKKFIAGLDEVGRGPLAGPVYAAAVILDPETRILGIKDSKKLSKASRDELAIQIKSSAIAYAIGVATPAEIDEINILNATKLAMKRALEALKLTPDHLLIDALLLKDVDISQTDIIKGDDLSVSIGAAAIIAKTARDEYMENISDTYPAYGFKSNVGYGTKEHIDAIRSIGLCEIHRKTFTKNFVE